MKDHKNYGINYNQISKDQLDQDPEKEILFAAGQNSDTVKVETPEEAEKESDGVIVTPQIVNPEGEKPFEVTGCSNLNLRSDKVQDPKNIIGLLSKGAIVQLSEESSDDTWAFVSTEFGVDGYVMRSYLREM